MPDVQRDKLLSVELTEHRQLCGGRVFGSQAKARSRKGQIPELWVFAPLRESLSDDSLSNETTAAIRRS